jgi:hypothetical protein
MMLSASQFSFGRSPMQLQNASTSDCNFKLRFLPIPTMMKSEIYAPCRSVTCSPSVTVHCSPKPRNGKEIRARWLSRIELEEIKKEAKKAISLMEENT